MFLIKLISDILTEGYYQFDMTKPQLDLRILNNVKFWLLSYWFWTSIKLKLNSKLQMFPIKLILGLLTEGYYQFDMTKPKLDLRTSKDVKFWLLLYQFWMLIKPKLNSKLQMFPMKLILGISTEGYYQFDMTKPQLDLRTSNDVKFWLLSYQFRLLIKLKLNSKLQMFPIKLKLGILTKGYYQFNMTKPKLDLRTSNNIKFWLLSYRFRKSWYIPYFNIPYFFILLIIPLKYKYTIWNLPNASILFKKYIENMQVVLKLVFQQQHNLHIFNV